MDDDIAIEVKGLAKIYHLYDHPLDRIKETFHPRQKIYHKKFYALSDINFSARKGEVLGVVGRNGSGKSTLLQIITGVLTPSSGTVVTRGKISALLELGAGFNPDLTGLENIYFNSSLLGYTKEEIEGKLDEILAFADIGDFIGQPVKTYSSGMFVRLAFAVAINVDPDILIIDEALSVGDFRFQQKCLRKIRQFKADGKTILFVSHSTISVIEFCDRVIWLLDGRIERSGDPGEICKDYIAHLSYGELSVGKKTPGGTLPVNQSGGQGNEGGGGAIVFTPVSDNSSFGERGVVITGVALYAKTSGEKITIFEGGERVIFYIELQVLVDVADPIVGFHLSDNKGIYILGLNSALMGVNIGPLGAGTRKIVEFEFDFPFLKTGMYSFSPAVASGTQMENIQHHWVHDAYVVNIASLDEAAQMGHYLVLKNNLAVRVS